MKMGEEINLPKDSKEVVELCEPCESDSGRVPSRRERHRLESPKLYP